MLADIVTDTHRPQITAKVILDATSKMFGFTVEALRGKSRQRPLVLARQIGMFVFRDLTELSYPAIAREFGGRDHTTVIHAVEKIGALMKERRQIYDQVTELIQAIRSSRRREPPMRPVRDDRWDNRVDSGPPPVDSGPSSTGGPVSEPSSLCDPGDDGGTEASPADLPEWPRHPQSTGPITTTTYLS